MPIIGISQQYWEFQGSESQVYVKHKQVVASPELRRLYPEQRGCLFRDEAKVHRSSARTWRLPIYTHNLCKMACRRRMAKKLCKCIPFFYRTLGQSIIHILRLSRYLPLSFVTLVSSQVLTVASMKMTDRIVGRCAV
jgi:hypothetical protein